MNLKGELGVPLARLVQLVTEVVLVNNTAKTIDITVPAGKRWLLLGARIVNWDDVARTCSVTIMLEAAKTNTLRTLITDSLAQYAINQWPNNDADPAFTNGFCRVILDAGNTITAHWAAGGASAGATDTDGLIIEYLEIDYP